MCWTKERKDYYEGKMHASSVEFHVTEAQKEKIELWIKRDCTFLSDLGLMDYSLMVQAIILDNSPDQEAAWMEHYGGPEKMPLVNRYQDENGTSQLQIIHIGIIDFLQDWTCTKNLAMCIKFAECNKATIPP